MPVQQQIEPSQTEKVNPQLGDRVKVVGHLFPYMEKFVGREGTVDGAVTQHSCVVMLKGAQRRWFDFRELEVTQRKKA